MLGFGLMSLEGVDLKRNKRRGRESRVTKMSVIRVLVLGRMVVVDWDKQRNSAMENEQM